MCTEQSVSSLLSLSINTIVANTRRFVTDLEYIQCLPHHIKDIIVKKITTRTDKWKDFEFNLIFEAITHPYLKKINLSAALVDDNTLEILGKCHNLEKVYIGRYNRVNTCITSKGFINFFKNIPKLKILDVSNCLGFDDKALATLGLMCPQFEEINASNCDLTDVGLIELAKHVKNLKRIQVSNTQIGNSGLQVLVEKQGKNLTELRFDNCKSVNDDDIIIYIGANCPALEIWSFEGCMTKRCRTLVNFSQVKI